MQKSNVGRASGPRAQWVGDVKQRNRRLPYETAQANEAKESANHPPGKWVRERTQTIGLAEVAPEYLVCKSLSPYQGVAAGNGGAG